MPLLSDARKAVALVRRAIASRNAVIEVRQRLRAEGALPLHRFQVAVYFADSDVNLYQMRQWYKPLQKLAERWPVLILARNAPGAAALLEESGLPVAFVPKVGDLETVIAQQDIRIVLYVNQNTRNFQMFRYGRRWHVFINHGESDKMYMTTNQYKAYDYAFIAGEAARERLGRVLWDYDLDRRALEIGRPQADHFSGTLPYTADGRTVVLYAPTWEGDRPTAFYGSVATHGEKLVSALLATGRHRVIYRPHPRSGVENEAFGAANKRIIAALSAANAADPTAQHVYDDGPDLGWQLAAADVAVVDISAMVYDRLATGRPLFVTRPSDPRADVDTAGYLSDCEWLTVDQADDIVAQIERVQHDETSTARLALWSRHYFGDTTPGASTRRFHEAIDLLMQRWQEWNDAELSARRAEAVDEHDPDEVEPD
ncbi:CDP-glycerol glycerophosphotransferase family protein [Microbacterium gorillae]|uniref:CDP-glycerol glycerophosphotransferase family protein n=1 Tax=Microbacterium gorillae TaxID=1231063 RepID=UPI003D968048